MRTIEEVVTRMPDTKAFSVLDSGSSSTMRVRSLALLTPHSEGTCLNGSHSESHQPKSQMFEDIEGVEVVVDDFLIWGEAEDQHDIRNERVLRQRNLKLNKLGEESNQA